MEHTGQAVSDSLCPLCRCPGDRTTGSEQIALLDEIQNPPGPGQNKIPVPGLPVYRESHYQSEIKFFHFPYTHTQQPFMYPKAS